MKKILITVLSLAAASLANPTDSTPPKLTQTQEAEQSLRDQGTFLRPSILVLPTIAAPTARFSPPKAMQLSDMIKVVNSGFCSFSRFDIKTAPIWLSQPFAFELKTQNSNLPSSAKNVDRIRSSFMIPEDSYNDQFSKNIEAVAQSTLASAYANVLSDPEEAQKRATALLSESDQNSMLSDKAKLTGTELITQEQVDLANNAAYIAIPVVEQSTHEVKYSLLQGRVGQNYKVRMGAYIFKVHKDKGQFSLSLEAKQIYNGTSTVIDSTFHQDVPRNSKISKTQYVESQAFNSVLFKFQAGLKEVDDFKMGSQIYNTDGQDFAFDTRKSEVEDIKMDDKFWMKELVEEEDGTTNWEYLGWSNITNTPRGLDSTYKASPGQGARRRLGQVNDHCLARQNSNYSEESNSLAMFEAEAVTGTPEEGALVEEVARMNLDLQLSFKKQTLNFMVGDSLASPEQIFGVEAQFKASLGEQFRMPNFNFITRLSASISSINNDSIIEPKDDNSADISLNHVAALGLTLGIQKGFYIWRFFPYIQAGLGFQALYILGDADMDGKSSLDFDAYRPYLGTEMEVGSGFFFTPNVSVNAAIGYQTYAGLGSFEYNITDGDEDLVKNQEIDSFDKSHIDGLTYYLGFTFNTWSLFKNF
jgi:hypothetical protein